MSDDDRQESAAKALKLLQEEAELKGAARQNRYPEQKFFGYFCSYFPEELLLAADLEPLRLLPDSGNSTPAELPSYCCSLARGTLAREISGQWQDLIGVGFTHTCDTMQCLSGIWAAAGHTKTVDLVPPVMLKAQGASRYYLSELESLVVQLGVLTHTEISAAKIRASIGLCNRARELVSQLDALRPQLPSPLVSALLRAGQLMPRSEYIKALEACYPTIQAMAMPQEQRTGILISGAVLENDHLLAMIEDLGGRVVADDTCTGYRHYSGPRVSGRDNPLQDIVQRYTEMPPCPCKHRGLNERHNYLEALAQQRKARAAILVIRKFCEPHAWDSLSLARQLQNSGLRTLILELEGTDVGGQERTRLQAFLENLT
ncbi:2-hydroxyacyl-CoA dehydratase family protein [Desulfosporosinus sp. PR]|uniref:2-hydroxyacyl-CoA dehydratase subunit D n=1 Tax=Candidatus Desulfosporosinus nitrosoreducens TaxID=3401928 RepID=UPI0027FC179B|nr:2-hydroxyacyl-CoA dehydratase family protein [Desulfosporosinus sp. PR]MDQ7094509.1 2-hydroxyacyl-CoA dehydratase family protein [Desulfosporosinus sp. PR]